MSWPPRTLEQLRAAIGSLQESASFDAKAALPSSGKSRDISIDIAAMATDGGVIIYGLAEDKSAGTFVESSIALPGVVERFTSVVRTTLSDPPEFEAFTIETEPASGFLVVVVPASPLAPHMVEVKGEYRYYGRGPGGNVPLTGAEVDRLFERRARLERDAQSMLDAAIAEHPAPVADAEAHLHAAFRPVLSDMSFLARIVPPDDVERRAREVAGAAISSLRFATPWDPTLRYPLNGALQRRVDGYRLVSNFGAARIVELDLGDDGRAQAFLNGAAEITKNQTTGDREFFTLRDGSIAQTVAQLAAIVGRLCREAGYFGPVDGAVAVLGARSASTTLIHDFEAGFYLTNSPRPQLPDPYGRSGRWPAPLFETDPIRIARQLAGPFLDTARQGAGSDVFALRAP